MRLASPVLRFRTFLAPLLLAVSLLACGEGSQSGTNAARLSTGTLRIHAINIGQGQATLIVGPDGTTLLMDAGNYGTPASTKLIPYLARIGLPRASTLDYAIISHWHADHYGGFIHLLRDAAFDVRGAFYENGSGATSVKIQELRTLAASTTVRGVQPAAVGTIIPLGDGATATVVAANGKLIGGEQLTGLGDENDHSVALLVRYRDFELMVAGDLGGGKDDAACTGRNGTQDNLETPLARALTSGPTPLLSGHGVEVLMVNHHGSESSTNSDWMNLLSPRVAILGVGANSYEHPRLESVDGVLAARVPCVTAPAALVLQTDEGDLRPASTHVSFNGFVVGDVVVSTDGRRTFTLEGSGTIFNGPDERLAAGLPLALELDEVATDAGPGDAGLALAADAGSTLTPDAGLALTPDAGLALTPDAGLALAPDAGLALTPDAGLAPEPDAGLALEPDAGSTLESDAGSALAPDAGSTLEPDAGLALAPDAGLALVPDAGLALTPEPAGPLATTTTFEVSRLAVPHDKPLTLTAFVRADSLSATGGVAFHDEGRVLARVALTQGLASFTTSALAPGAHSLFAVYEGDGVFEASESAPAVVTVSEPISAPVPPGTPPPTEEPPTTPPTSPPGTTAADGGTTAADGGTTAADGGTTAADGGTTATPPAGPTPSGTAATPPAGCSSTGAGSTDLALMGALLSLMALLAAGTRRTRLRARARAAERQRPPKA